MAFSITRARALLASASAAACTLAALTVLPAAPALLAGSILGVAFARTFLSARVSAAVGS